ncbi:mannitol dehydrogenase family protein [Catelliglobosispora koreensis]|uniref:mannitol dehydrogenase family protein n=1 Tax=Catelliglobosispora koreensis TaxID=129052 RepID=UPI000368D5FA|nr:mannitol dehydrogenase family protein [Catelliglobosispora koreensis]
MGTKLSRAAVLPPGSGPLVEPGSFGSGIVHFGIGAFFRAHQAVYTEAAMAASGGDWGITAVAPRSHGVLDALIQQDLLFSVVTVGGGAPKAQVLSVLSDGLHAASDPAAVIKQLADPANKIVTLTVTEKAYNADSAIMRLLVTGLRVRGGAPITLLSCDNLPSNGTTLASVVLGLAPELTAVTFPSSMVDRIVPATTPSILEKVRAGLGCEDRAAVAAEPFSQWVIEDSFAAERPDWAAAGAQFTSDVAPWEHLKLRALNGVHSALAYLGALAGRDTIAEALRMPGMTGLLHRYVETEVRACLVPPEGVDVVAYGRSALERFANADLGHRTRQVAMDGTQKLPQRLLSVLNAVSEPRVATLIAAAWAEYAAMTPDLDDPLAEKVRADLSTEALFGESGVLAVPSEAHRAMIATWRGELARHGAAEVVRSEGLA